MLILYIFHALHHFVTKNLCTHVRQYIVLLFYIILRYEQKCIAENIMKNTEAYCLISVCSCFVIISKVYIFLSRYEWGGLVMAGCCFTDVDGMEGCGFTDVVLYISENHHHEHATDPRRLAKVVMAACGAVILRFHGVSNL
jgi:hypothetical protein